MFREHLAQLRVREQAATERAGELEQLGIQAMILEHHDAVVAHRFIEAQRQALADAVAFIESREIERFHGATVAPPSPQRKGRLLRSDMRRGYIRLDQRVRCLEASG